MEEQQHTDFDTQPIRKHTWAEGDPFVNAV